MSYEECFVVFVDILGFKAYLKRSETNPELLSKLAAALTFIDSFPAGIKEVEDNTQYGENGAMPLIRTAPIRALLASDSFVAFCKVDPLSLAQLLLIVRYLHDKLAYLGLIIRGAVTKGKMYWDPTWNGTVQPKADRIMFGPAFISAYELGEKKANSPRIIIDQTIRDYVASNNVRAEHFSVDPAKLLGDFFVKQRSENYHLDILSPKVARSQRDAIVVNWDQRSYTIKRYEDYSEHRRIHARLVALCDEGEQSTHLSVVRKYKWLRRYLHTCAPAHQDTIVL